VQPAKNEKASRKASKENQHTLSNKQTVELSAQQYDVGSAAQQNATLQQ